MRQPSMRQEWKDRLAERLESRAAAVAVVGLGYVGLPLLQRVLEAGFEAIGIETDAGRLDAVVEGEGGPETVELSVVHHAVDSGRCRLTDDRAAIGDADVVLICVPTPLAGGAPDLSSVLGAADSLAEHLRAGMLVSLESTTYPGTTEDVFRPRLETSGLVAGRDFALAFSPERIDPGNDRYGIASIPKIVGGLDEESSVLAKLFYETIADKVVLVGRPREAEMAKLLENTYRYVNITLANEFAMVANELGIDVWEVIEAAATKPFGFEAFYPGIGIGGHCIAVDPLYLTWRLRELGHSPFRLVELAREVDEFMPHYVVKRIQEILGRDEITLEGARVLLLGVTYKPGVADLRASRALEVLEYLKKAGAQVSFHDPLVDEVLVGEETLTSSELDASLADSDMTVILTPHPQYDWRDVVAKSNRVFDARGVTYGMTDSKIARL